MFNWQAAPTIGDGLGGGWEVGEHWANPDPTLSLAPGPDDLAQFTEAGNYPVSIHSDTSAGFLKLAASTANASTVQFNTIGHPLTLTAGNYSNVSLGIADGPDQAGTLFVFNSNNDEDSDFNGVINAETVGIGRGVGTEGTLTLDGHLDPAKPGTDDPLGKRHPQRPAGNVHRRRPLPRRPSGRRQRRRRHAQYSLWRDPQFRPRRWQRVGQPGRWQYQGSETYIDGTVNVDENGIWNQTGSIWCGVSGAGAINVTAGSQINVFELPFAGQTPAIGAV